MKHQAGATVLSTLAKGAPLRNLQKVGFGRGRGVENSLGQVRRKGGVTSKKKINEKKVGTQITGGEGPAKGNKVKALASRSSRKPEGRGRFS